MTYQQQFVLHVLAPTDADAGYEAAAWSPVAATVGDVDVRDVIRSDYEADVDLQDAVLPLSPATDALRVGWLVAFGAAPPAGASTIDELAGRELRIVVRRRVDVGAGVLTLTTRRLR